MERLKDGYSRPITNNEKETCDQAKDEGIDLTPQQKFSNEYLEVCIGGDLAPSLGDGKTFRRPRFLNDVF